MTDWKQTPTLDAFAAMYDEDDHDPISGAVCHRSRRATWADTAG